MELVSHELCHVQKKLIYLDCLLAFSLIYNLIPCNESVVYDYIISLKSLLKRSVNLDKC